MPEDINLQGHLSAIPKSCKFEMKLNLTCRLCAVLFSLLVMVTDRCCFADLKIRCFLVLFVRYHEHGRFHGKSWRVRAFYAKVKLSCSWRRQQRPSVPYYCGTSFTFDTFSGSTQGTADRSFSFKIPVVNFQPFRIAR